MEKDKMTSGEGYYYYFSGVNDAYTITHLSGADSASTVRYLFGFPGTGSSLTGPFKSHKEAEIALKEAVARMTGNLRAGARPEGTPIYVEDTSKYQLWNFEIPDGFYYYTNDLGVESTSFPIRKPNFRIDGPYKTFEESERARQTAIDQKSGFLKGWRFVLDDLLVGSKFVRKLIRPLSEYSEGYASYAKAEAGRLEFITGKIPGYNDLIKGNRSTAGVPQTLLDSWDKMGIQYSLPAGLRVIPQLTREDITNHSHL